MDRVSSPYKIGDIITGEVSGIQAYGIFVQLDAKTQGLIHISEFEDGYIEDITSKVQLGEEIRVIIIDIDEYSQKISLSVRALKNQNIPFYPARMKKRFRRSRGHIGFLTIEQAMPQWIAEGLQDMREDRFHLKKDRSKGE